MAFLLWIVPFLVIVGFIFLLPALWRREIYGRYSGSRPVACPDDQQPAVVHIDQRHAADTELEGIPELRMRNCSRWPERAQCNQACLSEAIAAQPYPEAPAIPGRKQIYHLPVLVAAFAAWCLGAIWHAPYLFRPRWMAAIGLTQPEVKQLIGWYSLHLVTLAACLLFAYGVAWLLAVCHRKGILPGLLMAVLLGGVLIAASAYALAAMPREFVVIEAGYAVLAVLTIGAIVGGLYDKLVLRPH